MAAIIHLSDVRRSFGAVHVLRGIDLDVQHGQLVALYGPSGSGKTTLLNLIGLLDTPSDGNIVIDNADVSHYGERKRAGLRRRQIAYIFQRDTLLPTYSAAENIDLALRLANVGYFQRRKRVREGLAAVGLREWADHYPAQLSGGQRQRIEVARALAQQTPIVLADEPTSGLDTRTSQRVLTLFRGIATERRTAFVIVSHDPLTAQYVDVAYDLHQGCLHERIATV